MPLYPAKKFVNYLSEKFGQGIFSDLYKVKNNYKYSLTWLGLRHGFTREYARQIYKRFFRVSYTKAKTEQIEKRKKKIGIINKRNREKRLDPTEKIIRCKNKNSPTYKGVLIELLSLNVCKSMGYTFTTKNMTREIDLNINGLRCDVKSAYKSTEINKHLYYRFATTKKQRISASFFFCYIVPLKTFYIIPNTGTTQILIPLETKDHRYVEYKDAWHLLEKGNLSEMQV